MSRVYRALLQLYPYDFRAAFEAEMLAAFDASPPRGGRRELLDLAAAAACEWLAKWRTDPITRGRSLPDLRMMRPPGITRAEWFGRV
jgi:hypothetical protein